MLSSYTAFEYMSQLDDVNTALTLNFSGQDLTHAPLSLRRCSGHSLTQVAPYAYFPLGSRSHLKQNNNIIIGSPETLCLTFLSEKMGTPVKDR